MYSTFSIYIYIIYIYRYIESVYERESETAATGFEVSLGKRRSLSNASQGL